MKYIIIVGMLFLSCSIWADDIVDLYGLEGERAARILKRYTPKIQMLETQLMDEMVSIQAGKPHRKLYEQLRAQKKRLIADIQRQQHMAYVDIQTVMYPEEKHLYSTLEVIETPESSRMRFVRAPRYSHHRKHDVVAKMIEFEALVTELMLTQQLDLHDQFCPVYHCIASFHQPKLQPYLAIFQHGVVKEKRIILDTLQHDSNPERRAAAAFLIGHCSDPKDIIHLLAPYVTDPDDGVRNNVMRVMAATIQKAHLQDVDPAPFIALLDSPYVTDRNKALYVLYGLADSARNQKIIIKTGGQYLLRLLQLSQPNNHDIAYLILKKISHQSFGDQSLQEWQSWVTTAQHIPPSLKIGHGHRIEKEQPR